MIFDLYSNMSENYTAIQINTPNKENDYYLIELKSNNGPDEGAYLLDNNFNGGILIEHIFPVDEIYTDEYNDFSYKITYKVIAEKNEKDLPIQQNVLFAQSTNSLTYKNDFFQMDIIDINEANEFYTIKITFINN